MNIALQGMCLNLTNQCNLSCKYCFTHPSPDVMTFDTAMKALDFLISPTPNINHHVYFFGGEPLLQYDLLQRIVLAAEELYTPKQIRFGATTNCTLLTEERLKFFAEHNVSLLFSIDGAPLTQDSQRPCNSYGLGLDGAPIETSLSSALIEHKFPAMLKYSPGSTFRSTITPYNVEHTIDNYLYARRHGFNGYFCTPDMSDEWSTSAMTALATAIFDIALIWYNDIIAEKGVLNFSALTNAFKVHYKNFPNRHPHERCGLGTTSIGVAPNGDLFGCQEAATYDRNHLFYIGDVFNGINPERHAALLNEVTGKSTCAERPERCAICLNAPHCHRRYCPSQHYARNQSISKRPLISCIYEDSLLRAAVAITKLDIAAVTKTDPDEVLDSPTLTKEWQTYSPLYKFFEKEENPNV